MNLNEDVFCWINESLIIGELLVMIGLIVSLLILIWILIMTSATFSTEENILIVKEYASALFEEVQLYKEQYDRFDYNFKQDFRLN